IATTLQPRLFINPVGLSTWRWSIECFNPASVAGEYLKIEFSTDGGATFIDLGGASSHILIDNSSCPGINTSNSGSFLALPNSFLSQNPSTVDQIGVFDVGGNGVGDNPSFINVNIEFAAKIPVYTLLLIVASPTTFTVGVIIGEQLNNNVGIQFDWIAEL